jgi:predicted transcriptional regulator
MIAKNRLLEMVNELPDEVDIDEMIYSLYLKQKLENAEKDIQEGKVVSHKDVIRETDTWFEK